MEKHNIDADDELPLFDESTLIRVYLEPSYGSRMDGLGYFRYYV